MLTIRLTYSSLIFARLTVYISHVYHLQREQSYEIFGHSKYSANIYFGHEDVGTWALGLSGSQEIATSRPNKMLALYLLIYRELREQLEIITVQDTEFSRNCNLE
jgi:hypothetical protein